MEKEKKNLYAAIAFLIVSIVTICAIPSQIEVNAILGTTSSVNSRWFPLLTSGGIGILALMELAAALRKYRKLKRQGGDGTAESKRSNRGIVRALAIFALFILYAITFKLFGFIIATLIFPPLALVVNGGKNWKYYVSFYLVAAITYLLFVYALKIVLP